jgi:VWFA-related protein
MTQQCHLSWLICCLLVTSVGAQQPSQPSAPQQPKATGEDLQDIVRITTNLVQVDAVVTKDGKQVTDLRAEDFELFEDGKPQKITNFSYISNIPSEPSHLAATASEDKTMPPVAPAVMRPGEVRRIVAFVVDDLAMSFESMAQARHQLRKYIDEQLQPNDLVAIIRTGGEVGSLQQFTNDKRLLHGAIDHLKWNPCSRTGISVFAPVGSGNFVASCGGMDIGNSLSAFRFVLKGMRYLPGRKSMLIFSDKLPTQQQEPGTLGTEQTPLGISDQASDTGNSISNETLLQKVAEMAIRSSVVIYGVDTRGLQVTGVTAADNLSS